MHKIYFIIISHLNKGWRSDYKRQHLQNLNIQEM